MPLESLIERFRGVSPVLLRYFIEQAEHARRIWAQLQRVIRTALQVIAATLIGSAAFLGIFQLIAPQILEAVREILPPAWYAWAAGFLASIATIAGVLARIMATPAINGRLTHCGAGSAPRRSASISPPDSASGLPDSLV